MAIVTTLLSGTGSLPNNLVAGCTVQYTSDIQAESYEWSILSKPETSNCYLDSPNSVSTRLVGIDVDGGVLVKLVINKDSIGERTFTSYISVPPTTPLPTPDEPSYTSDGLITNGKFQTSRETGIPAAWTIVDDNGILDSPNTGITRGRIIPVNYDSDGRYVMCLGDELFATENFAVDSELSFSQDVDFTGVRTLTLNIKYAKV